MEEVLGLVGGRSGEALTDSIHKKNKKVALIIGDKNGSGYDKADYVFQSDLSNKDEILEFFKSRNVRNVIIGTGHILAFELAEYLEKNNINISVNIEASYLCKDKYLFKSTIEKLGIKTPQSLLIKEYNDIKKYLKKDGGEIKLPCVLKSNIDVVQPELIHEKEKIIEKAKYILSLGSKVLIEEYIDGNDCTVLVCNDKNNVKSSPVLYYSKAKEYNLEGFKNAKSEKMNEQLELNLTSLSERIIQSLDIIGVSRVDYIVRENEIYVLEVNSVILSCYESTVMPMYKLNNINVADNIVETAISIFKNNNR